MSFNFYTNIPAGQNHASIFTDDAQVLNASDMSLQNKTVYINGIPLGRVISNYYLPGDNPSYAHTLSRFNVDGTFDNANAFDATGMNLQDITVETQARFAKDFITTISLKNHFYTYSNPPAGYNYAYIYTDDPQVLNASNNSLVNKIIKVNGGELGRVISNYAFDGNIANMAHTITRYDNAGIIDTSVSFTNKAGLQEYGIDGTGKVLMCLTVETTIKQPVDFIDTFELASATEVDYLYITNVVTDLPNLQHTKYSVLYMPVTLALPGELYAGNVEIFFNHVRMGTVVENFTCSVGADGELPYTLQKTSAWPQGTQIWGYVINEKRPFTADITSLILKPRTTFAVEGTKITFRSTSAAWKNLLTNYTGTESLYFDNVLVGDITTISLTNMLIDNNTLASYAGNTMSALQCIEIVVDNFNTELGFIDTNNEEFIFEKPYALPTFTGTWPLPRKVALTISTAAGSAELINGILYLYDGVTIPEGAHGLIGRRLIVNEQFIGIISENTENKIITFGVDLVEAGQMDRSLLQTIYGVWKVETTAATGRMPLCVGQQISLCDWPQYPYFTITGCEYSTIYAYDKSKIAVYPNGLNIYTRRDQIGLNSVTEALLGHDLPGWVEHAHVDPAAGTFVLAESATMEPTLPARARYGYNLMALANSLASFGAFEKVPLARSMWQWGRIDTVARETLKTMGNQVWYPQTFDKTYGYQNIPGKLNNLRYNQAMEAPNSIYSKFSLVPTNEIFFYGTFKSDKFYGTNAVVSFNGEMYIKLDLLGEMYVGEYTPLTVYSAGNVVKMNDGTYQISNGSTLLPYTATGTPEDSWQLLTNTGYYNGLASYQLYDLIIDEITGDIFFAADTITGAPTLGVMNGWFYLVNTLALISRKSLVETSVLEIAACPQAISVESSILELLSAGIFVTEATVIEKCAPTSLAKYTHLADPSSVMIQDLSVTRLYLPYVNLTFNASTDLVATQVESMLAPKVELTSSILNQTRTAFSLETFVKQSIKPLTTLKQVDTQIALQYVTSGITVNSNPGQFIYDTVVKKLYTYDGASMLRVIGLQVIESDTQPSNTQNVWLDSLGIFRAYNGEQWLPITDTKNSLPSVLFLRGLDAAKPTDVPYKSLYYSTDTGTLYQFTGLSWVSTGVSVYDQDTAPGNTSALWYTGAGDKFLRYYDTIANAWTILTLYNSTIVLQVGEYTTATMPTFLYQGTVAVNIDTQECFVGTVISGHSMSWPVLLTTLPLGTPAVAEAIVYEASTGRASFVETSGTIGQDLTTKLNSRTILQIAQTVSTNVNGAITKDIPVYALDTNMLYVQIAGTVRAYKPVVASGIAPTDLKVIWFSTIDSMYKQYINSVGWQNITSLAIGGITMQFKRGYKSNLPLEAAAGEPLVTLDTGELYIGGGAGNPLKKVSDVVLSTTEPAVSDRNKMWIDQATNIAKVFKDGSWQVVATPANVDYGTF